jgi:hypothetical protein
MPPRRPLASLPFFLLAAGVGLTAWYGQKWYELPRYTDAELHASVELNLQMDLQRMPVSDPAQVDRLRGLVRAEVLADVEKERRDVESGLGLGLIALVVGFGNLLFMRLLRQR